MINQPQNLVNHVIKKLKEGYTQKKDVWDSYSCTVSDLNQIHKLRVLIPALNMLCEYTEYLNALDKNGKIALFDRLLGLGRAFERSNRIDSHNEIQPEAYIAIVEFVEWWNNLKLITDNIEWKLKNVGDGSLGKIITTLLRQNKDRMRIPCDLRSLLESNHVIGELNTIAANSTRRLSNEELENLSKQITLGLNNLQNYSGNKNLMHQQCRDIYTESVARLSQSILDNHITPTRR